MSRLRSGWIALAVLVASLTTACTTTYTRDGVALPQEYSDAIEAQKENEPVDFEKERIVSVVESVRFERGTELLRDLQWLIARRELALPVIVESLPETDLRTRAHLLYVLGFTRTKESTAALTSHMHYPDEIVRFEAAAGLLNHGDTASVPVLIDFLENADRRFRYKAIEALKKSLGEDFNYEFAAPAELRAPAVAQWRRWWQDEKNRLMFRSESEAVSVGN